MQIQAKITSRNHWNYWRRNFKIIKRSISIALLPISHQGWLREIMLQLIDMWNPIVRSGQILKKARKKLWSTHHTLRQKEIGTWMSSSLWRSRDWRRKLSGSSSWRRKPRIWEGNLLWDMPILTPVSRNDLFLHLFIAYFIEESISMQYCLSRLICDKLQLLLNTNNEQSPIID